MSPLPPTLLARADDAVCCDALVRHWHFCDITLRGSGELPYEWLEDRGRWMRKPLTFVSVQEALKYAAADYRKDLWAAAECRVQIWLEKDALAGVVEPITIKYDVALMVSRG